MTEKNASGRFVAGNSGKGAATRNRGGHNRLQLIQGKLEPHQDEVIASIVELAKAGDTMAQRLYMQYLAPVKPEERVSLPGFAAARTPKEKADIVAAALETGAISVEAAERLMNFTRMFQAAVVAEEHERRLAVLEGKRVEPVPVEYHEVKDPI